MDEQEKMPDSKYFGHDELADPAVDPVAEPRGTIPTEDAPPVPEPEAFPVGHDYRPYIQYVRKESTEVGEPMIVNMGPQHPSTHGVLRVELIMSGEEVQDVRCHIGYMHRCAEKESENSNYLQIVPYTD